MIFQTESVRVSGSADNAKVDYYILNMSDEIKWKDRPMVIVCPGGGYCFVSDREAEALALKWNSYGYHAAVLYYSVEPARFPTALEELATVVSTVYDRANKWHVDTDKIFIQGSSAGGHLVASYGMFWKEEFIRKDLGMADDTRLKVAGMILNYPVITSGEFAHHDSFKNLLGDEYEARKDEMSLEKRVNKNTPPAFIWTTNEDGLVPAESSLYLALAMRKMGISVELHMYAHGGHGEALANEVTNDMGDNNIVPENQGWIELAHTWTKGI